jgi:hypothetical protein
MGIASNHADVMHWFPRHGTDMDCFREEVEKAVEKSANADALTDGAGTNSAESSGAGTGNVQPVTIPSGSIPSPGAEEAVRWAIETGILRGDPDGSLRLRDPVTREEAVILLHRADKLAKAEAAQTDS